MALLVVHNLHTLRCAIVLGTHSVCQRDLDTMQKFGDYRKPRDRVVPIYHAMLSEGGRAMHRFLGFLSTMILLLAIQMLTAFWQSASAETITVSQTGTTDTQSIDEAILIASAGDTIRVAAGSYYEGGLYILTERVTLLGAGPDSTICRYAWPMSVYIAADSVTIEGFTFDYDTDGRSASAQSSVMGISSQRGDLIRPFIRGNRFIGGYAAINLYGNVQPIIQYNEFLTQLGLILLDNPNAIDARHNWWNTDERTSIAEKILDGQDEDGLGIVEFDPWLSKPGGLIRTAVERLNWGKLKRIYLPKEE